MSNSQILTNQPNDNLRILADATDELEEEIMSAPTEQPPPLKRRRIYSEDSVSPSISSQQDMDLEMATEQLLESFSQQDDAIEFRHRAMASCTESRTIPFYTMGDNFRVEELEDTWSGEHVGDFNFFDTVPTIVMVEEPSQASEGKSDSEPSISESFSPLPEGKIGRAHV